MTVVVGVLLTLLALASTSGAGLELELERLQRRELALPVLGSLIANVVVIPGCAVSLLRWLQVPPDTFLALALVSLAPGGASAPLIARLAGGAPNRIAVLYVALCGALLPTLIWIAPQILPSSSDGPRVLSTVIGLQLLPLFAGLAVRHWWPSRASRLSAALRKAGSALLLGVTAVLLITRGGFLATLGVRSLLGMAGVAAISVIAGGALAPAPRLPDALLACVRNLTVALILMELAHPGGAATLIIAAYGLVMYLVAGACVVVRSSQRRSSALAP